MADSISFFLFLFLPPLGIAFALQFAVGQKGRHRLRRWVAGLWVALVAALTAYADEPGHWLGVALFLAMLLGFFFTVAYSGALLGSHAALRLQRPRP
jgi:hypothetical protein